MSSMDINEVRRYLPHRYPFLLIDRVLSYEAGKSLTALKNVTINEPFFNGHFPHHPVMPGVLIIEAMAQAAALLSFVTMGVQGDDQSIYYFIGIDNARFKRPVTAGDTLHLHVTLTRHVRNIWKFSAQAMIGDVLAAEAELMCTVRDLPGGA
jgi:3-hydroxyacyl-[acyl-carrier-protein] dehydratase